MSSITLRFPVEHEAIGADGLVHGGTVMRWIDQAGHACATHWARASCTMVYCSSIRMRRLARLGDLIEVQSRLAFTGEHNMNITVEVRCGKPTDETLHDMAECLVVYLALDTEGKQVRVSHWAPETPGEMALAKTAREKFDSTRPAPLE